jgi:CO dehydrogenase/acetyl-CoA synthase gamma subunit (corrinoid Fe-S protein)
MPKTNCKACGYARCMAYAAVLREDKIRPEDSQLLLVAICLLSTALKLIEVL